MSVLKRISLLAVLAMVTSFCGKSDKTDSGGAASEKESKVEAKAPFSKGKELAILKSKKLNEVSGLAASSINPGKLWTLNDSNNPAEVYLIDLETNIKCTYALSGVSNRDWEEIGVGPGPEPGKQYVYVGDIGDNLAAHQFKYIYRFKEPVYKDGNDKGKVEIVDFDTITFSLSDERRDTEAFFVDPLTRDIYVISKWKNDVDLYRLPYSESTTEPQVAQHVATLPLSMVVAASMNSDGTELLVKTYKGIYYWKRESDTSIINMLQNPGTELPYREEPQGEAIAWATGGAGYYTLSEKKNGEQIKLMYYGRNGN